MATLADIDTNSLVQKYLDRQVTTPKADPSANSGDEVAAVLEAVAITLLLYPQAALPLLLRSKNVLQQIVQEDIKILTLISQAIDDINNPDDPIDDSSDLVDAQTALVELDRLGKVGQGIQAYDRYNTAINSFLDNQLAKPLKRHGRLRDGAHEFERSGSEARQDILQALLLFQAAHQAVIQRRAELQSSITNFQSVDLTRIVAGKTVARVRSSIQQIITGIQQQNLSKMVMALELMSGAASLKSISNIRGILDPLVDTIHTIPDGRAISVSSDLPPATAISTAGPWDIHAIGTPWNFSLGIDGGSTHSYELPATAVSARVFVISYPPGQATYNIPASSTLYVRVVEAGITTDIPITLTTGGAVPFATLVTDINTGMGVHGGCKELYSGAKRFIVYGSNTATQVSILSTIAGTVGGGGAYTPANPSAHLILGFKDNQTSAGLGIFTPVSVMDILQGQITGVTMSIQNGLLVISSNTSSALSELSFSGTITSAFGFFGLVTCHPTELEVVEGGQAVDAGSLNILPGALVVTTEIGSLPGGEETFSAQVATVSGNELLFPPLPPLPRGIALPVIITSAMVVTMKKLLTDLSLQPLLDTDFFDLQKVMSPILGKPTTAQINDAKTAIQNVLNKLTGSYALLQVLQAAAVRDDQTNFLDISNTISQTLEERGLDRAEDLLMRGLFPDFFNLTVEAASTAGHFLNAMEQIGQNDLSSTTVEADMADGNPVQGTGPETTLQPMDPGS